METNFKNAETKFLISLFIASIIAMVMIGILGYIIGATSMLKMEINNLPKSNYIETTQFTKNTETPTILVEISNKEWIEYQRYIKEERTGVLISEEQYEGVKKYRESMKTRNQ